MSEDEAAAKPLHLKEKIITLPELAQRAEALRVRGQRLVLTNGCFDLLHVGHVRYLEQARRLGEKLAVAVNGDESVRKLKGVGRPLNSEQDRAEIVAALGAVDFVIIFRPERATEVIRAVRPAVYAKGGDYKIEDLNAEEVAALKAVGAQIEILPLVPGKSSSALIAQIGRR
jgi:rfaE bifunctional protein nucleotidyltransferase chain/domain